MFFPKSTSYWVAITKVSYVFWNLQVIGWLKTNGKFTVLNSTSVYTKVLHVFLEINELLGGQLQKFCIFLFFPQINKLLGDTYKSLLCFLKSLEKWVARNSLLQKFRMFFPQIDKLLGGNYKSLLCFFEIVRKMGG